MKMSIEIHITEMENRTELVLTETDEMAYVEKRRNSWFINYLDNLSGKLIADNRCFPEKQNAIANASANMVFSFLYKNMMLETINNN